MTGPTNPLRGTDPAFWKGDRFGPGSQKEDETGTRHPRRLENANTMSIDSTGMQPRAHARVFDQTIQTIANNTATIVSFNTIDHDTIGVFSAAANSFTIPNYGYAIRDHWLVQGAVAWEVGTLAAPHNLILWITLNGLGAGGVSNGIASDYAVAPTNTGGIAVSQKVSRIIHPNPGDIFQLVVLQATGAAQSIQGNLVPGPAIWFEILHIW